MTAGHIHGVLMQKAVGIGPVSDERVYLHTVNAGTGSCGVYLALGQLLSCEEPSCPPGANPAGNIVAQILV